MLLGCSNGKAKTLQAQDNLDTLSQASVTIWCQVSVRPSIWLDEKEVVTTQLSKSRLFSSGFSGF